MRALVWYWGRRGGGAQYTASVLEALSDRRDLSVTASLSTVLETRDRITHLTTPSMFARLHPPIDVAQLVPGPFSIGGRAKRNGVDVILHTMVNPLTPLGLRTIQRSIRVVTVVHDALPHPGDEKVTMTRALSHALNRSSRLITPSEQGREQIRSLGVQTPVDVIPLPLLKRLPDCFDPQGKVLFFGRLLPYKGLNLLADAWDTLPSNRPALVLAGEPPNSYDLAILRRPGIEIRSGWIAEHDIAELFAGTRLVVLPYIEASQSGIIPLAEAAGIPILVTNVGGLPEQVDSNALVVEATTEAIAEGLQALLFGDGLRNLRAGALAKRTSAPNSSFGDSLFRTLSAALQ
jgi:glycosyltransferase involved in cell wall biosynthesis